MERDTQQRGAGPGGSRFNNTAAWGVSFWKGAEFMFRLACSVLLTSTIAPSFQQPQSEREKDVYAIYSLMLTNPQTSHGPDNNPRYLIAPATVPGTPEVPCVVPPKERAAEFRKVREDFERRKFTQQQLKPAFSIQKPYVLLSADKDFAPPTASTGIRSLVR